MCIPITPVSFFFLSFVSFLFRYENIESGLNLVKSRDLLNSVRNELPDYTIDCREIVKLLENYVRFARGCVLTLCAMWHTRESRTNCQI